MTSDTPRNTDREHLDRELHALHDALDALGAAERDATPEGLERELLASTLAHLRGEAHEDDDAAPPVIARIGFGRPAALRLAAAIAILVCGSIAGVLIINAPGPSGAPPSGPVADRSTEQIIGEIDAELDEWLTDLEALEDVYTDNDAAGADGFWSLDGDVTLLEEVTS